MPIKTRAESKKKSIKETKDLTNTTHESNKRGRKMPKTRQKRLCTKNGSISISNSNNISTPLVISISDNSNISSISVDLINEKENIVEDDLVNLLLMEDDVEEIKDNNCINIIDENISGKNENKVGSISNTDHVNETTSKENDVNPDLIIYDDSIHKMTNNVSDSSDDDLSIIQSEATSEVDTAEFSESDYEDCTNLFSVNYKAERSKAYENLQEDLTVMKNNSFTSMKDDECISNKEIPNNKKGSLRPRNEKNNCIELNDDSPSLEVSLDDDEISNLQNSPNISLNISPSDINEKASKCRMTKKTKLALQTLKTFNERFQQEINTLSADNSIDDITIVDDIDSEILIRIRWGLSYLKIPFEKDRKFGFLYKELADKYQVSVNQVVLNFQDGILSPDSTPKEIGLSVADIIEGGLIKENEQEKETSLQTTKVPEKNPDDIMLKIQNCNRRDNSMTLKINKFDAFSILMKQYSEAKNITLDKLKFTFDGETIKPSDTPIDLDLEEGDCIDCTEL